MSADSATPMGRMYGRIPPIVARVLGIADEFVPEEHPDRGVGKGKAWPLPIADDVLDLDGNSTDLVELVGRYHLEHGLGVYGGQGASRVRRGDGDLRGINHSRVRVGHPHMKVDAEPMAPPDYLDENPGFSPKGVRIQ